MHALRRLLPLALAALLPACQCAKVPDDALFACEAVTDCPSGERCLEGFCRAALDGALPQADGGPGPADAGPGVGEADCWNRADDDLDGATDCADPDCLGRACGGQGACVAAGGCECPAGRKLCEGVGLCVECCGNNDCLPKGSTCSQGSCSCQGGPACEGDEICLGTGCGCPAEAPFACGEGRCRACCTDEDCPGLQNCGPDGTCSPCSGPLEPCCRSDLACGAGLICLNDGLCAPCGELDGPCCAAGGCPPSGGFAQACQLGTCSTRGFEGQPCTFDGRCFAGANCPVLGDACESCGGPGEPCCPGNSCSDGGCCIAGTCAAAATLCGNTANNAGTCQAAGCVSAASTGNPYCGKAGQPPCVLGEFVFCTAPGTRVPATGETDRSCKPCGDEGVACCAGSACLNASTVCREQLCIPCTPGNPCCAGGACTGGCCVGGTCVGLGQPCAPDEPGLGLCLASGRCGGCGAKDQPCCVGPDNAPSVCNPSLTCSSEKLCE